MTKLTVLDKTIAKLTIYQAAEMGVEGRAVLAEWLRDKADDLEAEGERYSHQFVARYLAPSQESEG